MHTQHTQRYAAGLGSIVAIVIGTLALLLCVGFVFVARDQGGVIPRILRAPVSLTDRAASVPVISSSPSRSEPARFSFKGNTVVPLPSESAADALAPSANVALVQRIVIAEVCPGVSSAQHEYIELFNPNAHPVDLIGWQLRKTTESGTDSTLVSKQKFAGTVAAQSYFLVSHPQYQSALGADLVWSSAGYSIAAKNTITLLDGKGTVMDAITIPADINGSCVSRTGPDENTFVVASSLPRTSSSPTGFRKPVPYSSQIPSPSPTTVSPSPLAPFVEPSPVAIVSPSPAPVLSPSPSPESSPSPSPVKAHPSIMFVQFGIEGNANADYIELRNNGEDALALDGYKLVKKTAASGNEYTVKSWSGSDAVVQGNSYFYWVNSSYTEKINELIAQGKTVSTTTATITETNGVALKYQDIVVSSLQW